MFSVRSRFVFCSHSISSAKKLKRLQSTKCAYNPETSATDFSLDKYDAIGFDLDHTLCRYNLIPLFHLIYNTLASFLVEKYDYPNELTNIHESDLAFAQKGLVLDKRRGNFLKLDHQHRIVRASHGTRLLNPQEIVQRYGANRMWREAVTGIPQKLVLSSAIEEPFYVFKDYFVTPGAAICAKMVDLLDAKRGGRELDEYSFWEHYLEGLFLMYGRHNFGDDRGGFFPALKERPQVYLRPCPHSVKMWLETIHRQKVTFLVTSANYDAADFIGEYCLGKDWKSHFDLVITFAGKPGFFWEKKPFCLLRNGVEEAGSKLSETNCVYTQGNFAELQDKCAKLSETAKPKMVYFGDSLIEDVYAASELAGCDTVAIVEELLTEGNGFPSSYWGSFFGDGQEGKSFWSHLLSQHSKFKIPHLEMISSSREKSPYNPRCLPGLPKIVLN